MLRVVSVAENMPPCVPILGLFDKFPPLPADWRNSEQVRQWFVALLDSPFARGFVRDISLQWNDTLRQSLLAAAQQSVIWDTIWSIFMQEGNKILPIPKPEPARIRERISQLLHFRREKNIKPSDLLTQGTGSSVTWKADLKVSSDGYSNGIMLHEATGKNGKYFGAVIDDPNGGIEVKTITQITPPKFVNVHDAMRWVEYVADGTTLGTVTQR